MEQLRKSEEVNGEQEPVRRRARGRRLGRRACEAEGTEVSKVPRAGYYVQSNDWPPFDTGGGLTLEDVHEAFTGVRLRSEDEDDDSSAMEWVAERSARLGSSS